MIGQYWLVQVNSDTRKVMFFPYYEVRDYHSCSIRRLCDDYTTVRQVVDFRVLVIRTALNIARKTIQDIPAHTVANLIVSYVLVWLVPAPIQSSLLTTESAKPPPWSTTPIRLFTLSPT